MTSGSNKAVLTAIFSNSIVTVLKFAAAIITHSASMMNEAIHSLMDTINQGFLYRGLVVGQRPADATHAFGHGQKKYLWNLWSAIGLFSIGAGFRHALKGGKLDDVRTLRRSFRLGFRSAIIYLKHLRRRQGIIELPVAGKTTVPDPLSTLLISFLLRLVTEGGCRFPVCCFSFCPCY